jgi:large subunit ribosomal protein L10
MVKEEKKQQVEEIKELTEKYPVIGILDLYKMPSRQLQMIRKNLRGESVIKMWKKSLIKRAIDKIEGKENIDKLFEFDIKEPALIFTNSNPFKIYKTLKQNKSRGYAKANDIAPKDIEIKAGPTNLMAGPAIGELQRIKIPAMIKEGKIHVRKDTTVVKEGETITEQIANVLKKLDIQPMYITINLVGVWEDGNVFGKDILDIDEEKFIQDLRNAHIYALNLSINAYYFNKESIKPLLQKAHNEGMNLGINANVLDKGVIKELIKKANTQGKVLSVKLNI